MGQTKKPQRPTRARPPKATTTAQPTTHTPGEPFAPIAGVLQRTPQGHGYLRDPLRAFAPAPSDVLVPAELIRAHALVEGAEISGIAGATPQGLQLSSIAQICGLPPERFAQRKPFEQLTAIDPHERFRLGDSNVLSMRVVELIAPIGKGTRGLIVAPPKAGKTQLLEEMTHAIHASAPDARLILLLIDERPEEVTHFRRTVPAEVFASSNDQSLTDHTRLAEITMAHVRCELECGRDVVVLIDSLTRMTRAFNLAGRGANRTMSGGIDARALEIPRRFFGLARNIEKGGSVTVIATALVETGSRDVYKRQLQHLVDAAFAHLLPACKKPQKLVVRCIAQFVQHQYDHFCRQRLRADIDARLLGSISKLLEPGRARRAGADHVGLQLACLELVRLPVEVIVTQRLLHRCRVE